MAWLSFAIDYGIIGLLLLLSVISLSVFIERWFFLKKLDVKKYGGSRRLLEIEITRKLGIIASIGSNAPYIGLLGTVLGIMFTFYSIGVEGYLNATGIMVGLALALKATAIGLVVAIPSIVFYNTLLRRVQVIPLGWEEIQGWKGDLLH